MSSLQYFDYKTHVLIIGPDTQMTLAHKYIMQQKQLVSVERWNSKVLLLFL